MHLQYKNQIVLQQGLWLTTCVISVFTCNQVSGSHTTGVGWQDGDGNVPHNGKAWSMGTRTATKFLSMATTFLSRALQSHKSAPTENSFVFIDSIRATETLEYYIII